MKIKPIVILAGLFAFVPVALTVPTSLQIAPSQNEVTLSWSDPIPYLETTYDPAGPWFPVPGASSPYTISVTAAHQFFRLNYGTLQTNLLPVAVDDFYVVLHDRTTTIPAPGVLANDSDPSSLALESLQLTPAWYGTASLGQDGSVTYTPPPLWVGQDAFQYVDSDGPRVGLPATVHITVSNNPPIVVAQTYGVPAGQTLEEPAPGVLAGGYDPDGDPFRAVIPQISGPANGTLLLNWDGSFNYTPNSGFTGVDTFMYEGTDQISNSVAATVSITVHAATPAPTVYSGTYGVAHDQDLYVGTPGVLTGANDAYGDLLSASLVTGTANGTLTLFMDGSFTYIPNPGFVGMDSFTYEAGVAEPNSVPAVITINVTNTAPVAAACAYSTAPGQALNIAAPGVLLNATDAENDPLTALWDSGPSNGTLVLNADGSFTYTPSAGFAGVDTFTYSATDGLTSSVPAVVSISVSNQPPLAVNYFFGVQPNQTLTVPTPGVLLNDSDAYSLTMTAQLDRGASNGVVALNANGSFTYTPSSGYVGPDSFTYSVSDGVTSSVPATVSLLVHATNAAPVALDHTYETEPNSTLLTEDPLVLDIYDSVLVGDTDADSDQLTAILMSGPTNAAAFTFNADGTFSYLPQIGFTGWDSFVYEAFDGLTYSLPALVKILVTYTQPTVVGSTYTTHVNTLLAEPDPGVLSQVEYNDDSPVAVSATVLKMPLHGTLTFSTNGGFQYLPNTNYLGTDRFTYQAYDGVSNLPPTAVRISVEDTAPIAEPDTYYVAVNGTLLVAAPGVLTNDYDDDDDPLQAVLEIPPEHGTFSLNADGSFYYAPEFGFSGEDTFTYVASDGVLESPPVTVSIWVTREPVALNDVYEYYPGVPLLVATTNGVLANDFDPSGDGLTAQFAGGSGLVTLYPDGSFLFNSPPSRSGTPITFQYRALLTNGTASAPATVTLLPLLGPATPPKLVLTELTFSGGTDVIPDKAGKDKQPFQAPQWKNAKGDGVIDTAAGDQAAPYSYVQGTTATIAAKFTAQDPNLAKLKSLTLLGVLFDQDKSEPLLMSVQAQAEGDGAGHFVLKATPTTGATFPNMVGKLNPLLVTWDYSTDNGGHYDLDVTRSRNVVYLTLNKPQKPKQTMFQTPLDLGCTQGAGATNNANLLSPSGGLWKYFATCKVRRASDGAFLTYYNDWGTSYCDLYELLQFGDGQCMTWAQMFTYALRCQGMDNTVANIVGFNRSDVGADLLANNKTPQFRAAIKKGFLVKNWKVAAGATTPYYDYVNITAAPNYNPEFRQTGVKANGTSNGQYLFNAAQPAPEFTYAGGQSQNNPNPAADFNCHFVVQVKNGATTSYYDPSYGNVYATPDAASAKAVAGYYEYKNLFTKNTYLSIVPPAAPLTLTVYYKFSY